MIPSCLGGGAPNLKLGMKNFHSQPSASLPCSPLLYDCPVCSSGALGPSLLHYERCLRFVFLSWKELSACFVSSRCHLFWEAQLRWHLFSDVVVQYPRWKDLARFNPTSLCFIALSISCISSFWTHPSAAVCPSRTLEVSLHPLPLLSWPRCSRNSVHIELRVCSFSTSHASIVA